ncbi:hypothetical protein [Mesorhizobium sp. Cs1321R2N1]|uniref:hypothetical protein n=1 Tax=Mesorhizobium sp. Cs1321R2N1 TaxID=3015174 RepID=UPI00301D8C0C
MSEADKLAAAERWLRETPRHERGGTTVPALQRRFGLSAAEACEVIAANNLRLARAT